MKKKIGYLVYIIVIINILFLLLATGLVYPKMVKAYEASAGNGIGYTTGLLIIWGIFVVANYLLLRYARKLIKTSTVNNALEKQTEV